MLRVAVLTISDSVAKGDRVDLSGPAVVQRCRHLGWEVVSSQNCSDSPDQVRSLLRRLADARQADLILTTGGTGLGPRDNTPEATLEIGEKVIPGLAEQMRRKGLEQTPTAVLSRGVAVIRSRSLIVNLPGSPKGAVESLDALASLLPHAIHVLHGARHD
jgi:molybdenum cofactor synthesis domain-containing protein